jgi:hypothetical protein
MSALGGFLCALPIFILVGFYLWVYIDCKKIEAMSPEERERWKEETRRVLEQMQEQSRTRQEEEAWGKYNAALVCPHCQNKGSVRVKPITKKTGISGAKATGAILTGGLSVLATGLSQKEDKTQAHCTNCRSTWVF